MGDFSFGTDWPWVGAIAGLILLYLLFFSTRLQADPSQSRWHDRTWLAWMASFSYFAHNIEEYGVDLSGRAYAFPASMMRVLAGMGQAPSNEFYLAVNLSLVWVGLPIAAMLSRRHPLIGLAGYAVMAINFLTHAGAYIAGGYNPGLFTAAVLFLPLTLWATYALFGPGKLSYKGFGVVILAGVVAHAVLMGSVQLLVRGLISGNVAAIIQVMNTILLMLVLWAGERILEARLYRRD
ncbi:HXXEE domain-containing protein [Bordetella petrii]|uniref:HXXEE domain-containing protein n=1 Tax=Bordetella petrii TaxID=94624 RepID=UPI001A966533|nr:HXXEE domain-containing protein [Bordetella petrii]MBO1113689.1 HXXEE domain-containing protein [Bordetella petrii]